MKLKHIYTVLLVLALVLFSSCANSETNKSSKVKRLEINGDIYATFKTEEMDISDELVGELFETNFITFYQDAEEEYKFQHDIQLRDNRGTIIYTDCRGSVVSGEIAVLFNGGTLYISPDTGYDMYGNIAEHNHSSGTNTIYVSYGSFTFDGWNYEIVE